MGRPRGFDQSEALKRALQLFWRKGYESSSLEQLLAATGLSKSSFYHSFGSKAELFAAALEIYQDGQATEIAERLEAEADPKQALKQLIASFTRPAAGEEQAWGCLTCNTAVELAPHEPRIAKLVADHQRRLEKIFASAFRNAQKDKRMALSHDARALASFVVAALSGLQVLARAGAERKRIDSAARIALDALD
jgi:TetR/AcrR family transcriptional repressor of nem operon